MSLDKAERVGKIHKNKGSLFIETNEIDGCRELETRRQEIGMEKERANQEINGCRETATRQDGHLDRDRGTGHEFAFPPRQGPRAK